MSSIIEDIDSSAHINKIANVEKSYESKKVHTNQKDKLVHCCSHGMMQSIKTETEIPNDQLENFNCNGNNDTDSSSKSDLNSHFSAFPKKQCEINSEISDTLCQFTFLDNDVPSLKDFPLMKNYKRSEPSIFSQKITINKDSISNLTSSDTKNVSTTNKLSNDSGKIKDLQIVINSSHIQNSIEKKEEEKVSENEKNVNENTKKYEEIQLRSIQYILYESELQMPQIMKLITNDLSEPYSIYTYRYFIHNWPKLCFLAMCGAECVGVIVCKLDYHKKVIKRGYIAMLAVAKGQRRNGIGSHLVVRAIQSMVADNCDEVVLETEITNKAALHLYENLGFVRDKRLFRYYLNGVDALRLKLWLK